MLSYLEKSLDWLRDKLMALVAEEPLRLSDILSELEKGSPKDKD